MLQRVMAHEAAHCSMHSYGLLDSLHRIIPEESWVPVEEWVCNYLADHGRETLHAASVALSAPIRRAS